MNTTPSAFGSADLLGLFSKYRRLIVTTTLLSVAVFALAAFVLPKRYKSSFVLTIYSHYFQNPLTRDFMSEIHDSTEMRAQREALIRQSFTPEFLDLIGEKYGIYGARTTQNFLQRFSKYLGDKYGLYLTARELRTRSDERKNLMERIEVLNLNSDSFRVGFIYSKPDVTYRVTQDIHAQVTRNIKDVRRNNLTSVQSAIQKRLEALSMRLPALERAAPTPMATAAAAEPAAPINLPMVEEELADVRSQLRVLTARYTDQHPLVKELRERERSLSSVAAGPAAAGTRTLAVRIPQDAAAEIYRELTKKLNYLNVSLDSDQIQSGDYYATLESALYPTAPLWPKKGLFLIWGLGLGLLGSLFIAAVRDFFERSALRPPVLSQRLNIPILGEIPLVHWGMAFPHALRSGRSLQRMAEHN